MDTDGYEWDFGDDSGSNATIASTEYTTGGIYDVQLTVNVEGCEASESMLIEVLSKDELLYTERISSLCAKS
jgi:PKD repeat protein